MTAVLQSGPSVQTVLVPVGLTLFSLVLGWGFHLLLRGSDKRTKAQQDADAAVAADIKAIRERLEKLERETGKMEVQISPLWAAAQLSISRDLHKPHKKYAEMDRLLEQLDDLSITPAGRTRLKELLVERSEDYDPEIDAEERTSAQMLILVMEKVLQEVAKPGPITQLQIVGTKDEDAPLGEEEEK